MKARTRREAAILIVGRVAGLREHLRWYDAKPLFGLKILVTRAKEQAAELSDQLAALGAEPVEAPMIRILPPGRFARRCCAPPGSSTSSTGSCSPAPTRWTR